MTKAQLQAKVQAYEKALEEIAKLRMPQNNPEQMMASGHIARHLAQEALHKIDPCWFIYN